MKMVGNLIVFRGKNVRRTIHNDEWWFCVIDIVAALTNSADPEGYLRDMRRRDPELAKTWKKMVYLISVETEGGKQKAKLR
jgi:prophage antirepressor-like protein